MSTTGTGTTTEGWTLQRALSTFAMVMIIEATALGFTIVSIALPQITQHFQTAQGGWLITGFVLAGAVLCPLVGKLADVYGKRRLMVVCLLVGFVGAVLATVAPTFGILILARLLQGAVLPTMFLSYSLMRDVFPVRILPLATAISMTGMGVFSVIMPFVVGRLLDGLGFRALFAFDIVWIAVLTPVLILTTPESSVRNRTKIDFLGGGLLGIGLGVLLLGVSMGSTWGWGSPATLGSIAAGVAMLVAFVLRALNYSAPIVDLRLFASRAVLLAAVTAAATYSMTGVYSSMAAIIAQTPREVGGDYGLGLSAFQFGLLAAPQALLMVLGGVVVGKLINRIGAANLMYLGLSLLIVAGLLIGFNHGSWPALMTAGMVMGLGTGLSYGAVPALVISATTAKNQASIASMVQVTYSSFSSITPVVLFMILGSYVTFASDGFVVYSSAAFETGGLYMVGVLVVLLLLGATVLRRHREDTMLREPVAPAAEQTDSALTR